ncbi:MAG: sacsin N-terminal ATP-binding-like domain-containing protein [Gaiellaceae bacterium]
MSAEQLSVESFHGLIEVVQNADDLHAREVRVGYRPQAGRRELLIVHDGDRVLLHHVIAMTLAFVSTKRDDPRAKGRFGIGLKTLGRLGETLTVHCEPYHFTIEGNQVRAASSARSIGGFFDTRATQTLFEVRLRPGFEFSEFASWFEGLGPESMLFLDEVRSLRLVSLQQRTRTLSHHRLTHVASQQIELPGVPESCRHTVIREPYRGRSWDRYEIERKVPGTVKRRYKRMDVTTPLALAVPDGSGVRGQLYAGLPLGITTQLPFAMNAQFDVDLARRGIQHESLNEWLLSRLADLVGGVALARLAAAPSTGWTAVPLAAECAVADDAWLSAQLADLIDSVQKRVRSRLELPVDHELRRLRELSYEDKPLEAVVEEREARLLQPRLVPLPRGARDRSDRWRAVLDELGGASLIEVEDALLLLDLDDDDLGARETRWFIKLARAAIEADLETTLWSQRCIVTADGERIVPPLPQVEGELLLRSARQRSLAIRLGIAHVIDAAYLRRSHDATVVRQWLEEEEMLRVAPDEQATLQALAARDEAKEPIELADADLLLLRDALEALEATEQRELGLEIGERVAIAVQQWQGGKRVPAADRAASSYLPPSIEERRDGWSKAAGRTPGISWVHPRYDTVLRRERGRRGTPRKMGARGFFGLLGAEVAPKLLEHDRVETRYGDPATPIEAHALSPTQRHEFARFRRYATHLKDDRTSPALLAVVRDIRRERALGKRQQRARALLAALERNWDRLYADHVTATAVYSYGSWHPAGEITGSWLAWASDEPWLTTEQGKARAPNELVARTPITEAIYGDDGSGFAAELSPQEATFSSVRALGVETDPEVDEMVEQLAALREEGAAAHPETVDLRYAAISTACATGDLEPDEMVGNITVRQLRRRFGTKGSREGLVFAGGAWLPPASVFLGAPIFGNRRPFVSARSHAEPLWRLLRISEPTLAACLDVLGEVAREEPDEDDHQILVNTYLRIESQLEGASARYATRLAKLPLWTGASWIKARPVYVVDEEELADQLGQQLPIWRLGIAPSAVPRLMKAVGAQPLTDEMFTAIVRRGADVVGATIERRFRRAVARLRDWLTRRDPKLHNAHAVSWDDLERARLAIDEHLQLELRLGRREPITVSARAHLAREPLTLYFADPEAAGDEEAGGRVIASLFAGDRDKLALAWRSAWDRADDDDRGAVALAEDVSDEKAIRELFEQARAAPGIPKRKPRKKPVAETDTQREEGPLPVRRLKPLEELADPRVALVTTISDGKRVAKGRRRGLREDLPPGRSVDAGERPAPRSAPLAYSPEEKESRALEALQIAINGEAAELSDYRHLRGVGADALDKLSRYFEIKSTYGPLPDEVTLTANEAERAFLEGDRFFLALVAGVEVGYETIVKVIPNPLRNLKFKPTSSVTLGGIERGGGTAVEVRFGPPPHESDGE